MNKTLNSKIQTAKVKDLNPHPLNVKLNPIEKNEEERKDLAKRFAEHFEQEGIPNHNPILICPETNTIWSGHNRYFTADEEGYDEVQIAYTTKKYDPNEPEEDQMYYLEQHNADGKRDEGKPSVILRKWHAMKEAHTDEDNKYRINAPYSDFFKDFAHSRKVTPKEFKQLLVVEEYNPVWIEDIETKKISSIQKAYDMTKAKEPDDKENPNRHNFIKTLDENPKIKQDIVNNTIKVLKDFKSISIGNKPMLFGDDISWETNALSAILSHTVMSATADAFKECKIPLVEDCITPGGLNKKQGYADVQFPSLNKDGFQKERIEVKAANAGATCASTNISSGLGATKIHPHEYMIVVWDNDFKRLFIMITTLTKEDWGSGSEGEKIMSMKTWHKNHYHNKDEYRFLIGEIYEDQKGLPKFDFGKTNI